MVAVDVSIILPCYNESRSLEKSVNKLKAIFDVSKFKYEIIIAEDGSTDGTDKIAKKLSEKDKKIVWLHRPKRMGRGNGVANAIKKSNGKIVGFTDTDLSTSPEHIIPLVLEIKNGADIAIARRIYQTKINAIPRWILSKGYSKFSRKLLNTPIKDSETGCKFFRKEKILPILDEIKDNHWFWDTEVIARSYYKGLKIVEHPTLFERKEGLGSSVNVVKDTIGYFKNLLKFRNEIIHSKNTSTLKEIGLNKAVKYCAGELLMALFPFVILSPFRVLFLKSLGAKIRTNVVLNNCKFFNIREKGFKALQIGNFCYIGIGCLFDLSESIILENHVTLAENITILTHANVGFKTHPLQKYFPKKKAPVVLKSGCFIGTNATILAGVTVGRCAVVGAGAVVTKNVPEYTVVGGVPATEIKKLS